MKVSSIVNFIINNSYLRCVSSSAILNSCSGYSLTVMKTIKQTFQVNNYKLKRTHSYKVQYEERGSYFFTIFINFLASFPSMSTTGRSTLSSAAFN